YTRFWCLEPPSPQAGGGSAEWCQPCAPPIWALLKRCATSKPMADDILTLPPPPADTRLTYGSDPNQFIDLRLPTSQEKIKPQYPLVINIHGGFWRAKYSRD